MKYLLLWIVFCVLALSGVGQKANYKSADRFTHHKLKTLIGTTKVKPEFLKHSDKFWYKYKTGDGVRYYFVDPKAKVHREMFDRKFVAGEINEKTHGTLHYKELDLSITFLKDEKTITFKVDNCPFVDLPSGDTLRCKLFPADKFYKISLYFDGRVKYNEVNGKAEVDCEKFYIARRK